MTKRMPAVFSGHGSPMVALANDDLTKGMRAIGDKILDEFGKPKAILSVSGHWCTNGSYVQKTDEPRQVYDMYGFPPELYQVKYPAKGCAELSDEVIRIMGDDVTVNNDWGIDHGTWTVLVHMFPKADIPVVQLSVDAFHGPARAYKIGQKIAELRDEGYMIFGSGNIVHNLSQVEWDNDNGTPAAESFNRDVITLTQQRDDQGLVAYKDIAYANYAVPTEDHYLPFLYVLGASEGESPLVFNNKCNLGSMAMTGFAFGM